MPRSESSWSLHRDAACQTMPAAALRLSSASQPSETATQRSLPTADVPLSHRTAARQDAQAPAVGKLKEPLRQLQHQHRDPPQPQIAQEGLVRTHSAPASMAATTSLLSTDQPLQPCARTQRDTAQQATLMLPESNMQHSHRLSRKPRRRLRGSSAPKTPSTAERQAWCNTFNPPRQQSAGRKPKGSSRHVIPPAQCTHPQSHLR